MPENVRKSAVITGGWLLGLIWALPILYALWAATLTHSVRALRRERTRTPRPAQESRPVGA